MNGAEREAVVDASVGLRWVLEEPGSLAALALLETDTVWLAPRLLLSEIASALARKVAVGQMELAAAERALAFFLESARMGDIRLAEDESVALPALRIAAEERHKLPDCIYVALAAQTGAALVTADRQQAAIAGRRKVEVTLLPSP